MFIITYKIIEITDFNAFSKTEINIYNYLLLNSNNREIILDSNKIKKLSEYLERAYGSIKNSISSLKRKKILILIERTEPNKVRSHYLNYEFHSKEYKKAAYIKHKYNLDMEDFISLKEKQQNKCLICGLEEKNCGTLHIDHDHKTNKVRGLLCFSCNRSLGGFKDSIKILKSAINYLQNNYN